MSSSEFCSLVVFLALVFENLVVVVCPRGPFGWASSGKDHRNPSGLDAYRASSSRQQQDNPAESRDPNAFVLPDDPTPDDFYRLSLWATQQTQISKEEHDRIQQFLQNVADTDNCSCGTIGFRTGKRNCLTALTEFLRVPKSSRGGFCYHAYLAGCYKPGSRPRECSFYIKTSPGRSRPVQGYWEPLSTCVRDLHGYSAFLPSASVLQSISFDAMDVDKH